MTLARKVPRTGLRGRGLGFLRVQNEQSFLFGILGNEGGGYAGLLHGIVMGSLLNLWNVYGG